MATNPGGTSSDVSGKTLTTPPNPPTVETNAPSAITQSTATLNATVNPNEGAVSDCHFEYGSTEAYGSTAPCSSLPGSGSSPVGVSAAAAGLSPNTTYHYRVLATSSGGTSRGADQTLTTLPTTPTVETTEASSLTQTTATLNATVNPNEGEVSDCHFEYGTSESYGSSVPCSSLPGSGSIPVAVSAPATGLSANTTYHFRILATNAGGTTTGSDHSFTTLPSPPTVQTGVASAVGQTTASLNATVNPNEGDVSDCRFEYGSSPSYGSSVPCSSLPGSGSAPVAVSAPATGLTANTTYHFRVAATNPGGSGSGSDQTFKTLPNPPTVVTSAGSSITHTSATLNATVNPNGGAVGDCHFEYGASEAYGSSAPCSSLPGAGSSPVAVSAPAGSLSANTTYHFRILATNPGGAGSGADQTLTTIEELPEVGRCQVVPAEGPGNVHHGSYTDPGCVTRSETNTGEYEWTPGFTKAGIRSTGGRSILETVGRTRITCKAEAGTGEYSGARTELITMTFTRCESASKASCQSEGASAGTIKDFLLEGQLGFIKNKPKEEKLPGVSVGWDLKPTGPEPYVTTFECGNGLKESPTHVLVSGSVITTNATIDKMSLTSALHYTASTGKQRPERFEGGAAAVLLTSVAGGAFEQSGLSTTQTVTSEELLEVKAHP